MPPIYDMACQVCMFEGDAFINSSEVENPIECPDCGQISYKRVWRKMPGTTRASYIDSNKTARAKDLEGLKRAAHLEVQKAGTKPSERGEISKEIKELTKIKK